MASFTWVGILAVVVAANAYEYIHPMENPDLFLGDILIEEGGDRNAVPTKNRRWPGGIVPYKIDPSVRIIALRLRMAMNYVEQDTCVRFVPYNGTQKDYIRIFAGQGCYSYVGYVAQGEQPVSLGRGCEWHGTMMHELIHALGFIHEQNRSDRDDYLTIYWDNIKAGAEDQFVKFRPDQNWLITPFDYGSIMLYNEYSFSKDRKNLKTMQAKKPGAKIGNPQFMTKKSADDTIRINVLYDCSHT